VVLNLLPDSSAVNVVVVFHHMPADAIWTTSAAAGVAGGYSSIPANGNDQRDEESGRGKYRLFSVRSLYSNKTFNSLP